MSKIRGFWIRFVCRAAMAGVVGAGLIAAGCAADSGGRSGHHFDDSGRAERVARRPAVISHVVLVALTDSAQRAEFLGACDGLAVIPGLEFFTAGPPLQMGRANVDTSFDVGLCMGFATKQSYLAYIDHPLHQKFLKEWGSRAKLIRVFDVVDETP